MATLHDRHIFAAFVLGLFFASAAGVSARIGTPVASTPAITATMFRANPQHTGMQPGPGPETDPNVVAELTIQSEQKGQPGPLSVVVIDGTVYASVGRDLAAFDTVTLEEQWRFSTGADFTSYQAIPAVGNGVVYAGSADNAFALDTETGKEKWRAPLAPEIGGTGPTTVADGTVYIPTTGSLVALDADDGSLLWTFPIEDGVHAGAAVADGLVYIGGYDEHFHAIDAATGEERWNYHAGDYINASVSVADGVVYMASLDGVLSARDASSGDELWRFEEKTSSCHHRRW